VAIDHVDLDIELKVRGRGRRKSKDRVLMSQTFRYSIRCCPPTTLFSECCEIALHFEKLEKTIQATIVSVCVTKAAKTWPFQNGGLVTCVTKGSSKPGELEDKCELSKEVVLEDQVRANQSDGYVDLSRHVVSVELAGMLEVIIREWRTECQSSKHTGHVFFEAQECKISRKTCYLGDSKVEVTVAWSLLLKDKSIIP
jgi:hypothetical protein